MDTILGIRGRDFSMLAADTLFKRSVVIMKDDVSKIHQISNNLAVATIGDPGDALHFSEYISKNISLYKMRHGYDLKPRHAIHFTRKNLAEFLRSKTPYSVNMYVAGYDPVEGPELCHIDYLASSKSVNFGGHGIGLMFIFGIFDRYWHPNITQEEAYNVIKICVAEIQKRFVVNLRNFSVTVVNANGVSELPPITPQIIQGKNEKA